MTLDFELKHTSTPQVAVLLFHGMTGSPFEMKKYGQYLHGFGYDVYAYCLSGHGDYVDKIKQVTFQDWLKDAYSQFEKLNSKYKKVFIGGLCLGAVLCLAISIKYQNRVAGIIALSTTLFLDGWRMPWYSFLLPIGLSTIIRYYYTYPECEPYGIKNIKTRAIIQRLLCKSDAALDNFPMTCIYELLELSKYVRNQLHKVNSPILIIHSNEDDLTSKKSAYFVYNKISSLDKRIFILDNSYHMVLYDNEKEFVHKESSFFIKSLIEHSGTFKISKNVFSTELKNENFI